MGETKGKERPVPNSACVGKQKLTGPLVEHAAPDVDTVQRGTEVNVEMNVEMNAEVTSPNADRTWIGVRCV